MFVKSVCDFSTYSWPKFVSTICVDVQFLNAPLRSFGQKSTSSSILVFLSPIPKKGTFSTALFLYLVLLQWWWSYCSLVSYRRFCQGLCGIPTFPVVFSSLLDKGSLFQYVYCGDYHSFTNAVCILSYRRLFTDYNNSFSREHQRESARSFE